MIRVCHLISGLEVGGAETTLSRLLSRFDPARFSSSVISLTSRGLLGDGIERLGVPVTALGMTRGRPSVRGAISLLRALRSAKPDVLQTWMYHADLAGFATGRLLRIPALVWNVRASDMDMSRYGALSAAVVRACSAFADRADAVVVNSESGRLHHEQIGYRPRRWCVIPNGIDCDEFRPSSAARAAIRGELRVPDGVPLVGLVARFDPMKDHRTFLRAVGAVARRRPAVHFVLAGRDVTAGNPELAAWIDAEGLRGRVSLLGQRSDIARLDAALDVAVLSSSFGEGFPNVVAEAMAAGVPAVVTDVGAAAAIVGDTGLVVPPRDPEALAAALERMLDEGAEGRRRRGEEARCRVQSRYDLPTVVRAYEDLYDGLFHR